MNSKDCIIKNTTMSAQEKEAALTIYEQYEMTYKNDQGRIAESTFDALKYQSYLRRKQNLMHAKVSMERWLDVEKFIDETGRPLDAVQSLLVEDKDGFMKGRDLEVTRNMYRAKAFAKLSKLIEEYGKKGMFGFRKGAESVLERGPLNLKGNKESFTDLLKEIFEEGDSGNDIAKALASAVKEVYEDQRNLINKYGGNIPKLEKVLPNGKVVKYFMPQDHDMLKIRSVDRAVWAREITELLDRDSMLNYKTNQPYTDIEFQFLLDDVYDAIVTDGMSRRVSKISPNARRGNSGGGLSASHRVFQFKDSASWYTYQKKYGQSDVFNTILNQVNRNAAHIAELQVLGPQPLKAIDFLIEKSRAKYIADPKMASDIAKTRSTLITTLDVFHNQGTHVKNEFAAEAGSAVRNILASIQLGKAAISAAFGDQATVRQVAQDIGMSQTATMTRILKSTLAAHKGRERNTQLSKMGVIMENAINLSVAQSRYAGEVSGPFISQVIPDVVLRATGLSPITQAARSAFNFEFMAYFAESLGKNYNQLDVNFKRMLVRFGLDKDWSVLTQVKPYDWDGTKMLSFVEIDEANIPGVDLTDLSNRFLSMQRSLTDDAVIVSSLREQVATGAALPRGSVAGELVRFTMSYKHFATTVMIKHLYRLIKDRSIKQDFFGVTVPKPVARTILMTEFLAFSTLMGAFSEQLNQISKGNDPWDMTTKDFWYRSAWRGGGLGLVGEVFNNTWEGVGEKVGGPGASLAIDTVKLVKEGLAEITDPDQANIVNELMKYAKKYTPGQSMWWGGLAFKRMIIEQAAMFADPDIENKLDTERRRQETRNNQEKWWKPGSLLPERAPNLEAANVEQGIDDITEFVTQ
tara:strand:+ start:6198 stop:8783 length:2586 start_codon:yes stop_codon:yes gene_type:complete